MDHPAADTDPSLIAGLAGPAAEPAAWERFAARYGPQVRGWCRAWGLQPADADDVTQDVMVEVARQVGRYRRQRVGSFRRWLRTVARGAYSDYVAAARRQARAAAAPLLAPAAADDLLARLEHEYDLELAERAMARVRERVADSTWTMFDRTALGGETGAAVAAELGVVVGSVYAARSKVQRLIREEVARLDAGG
ncbi:MAG: sigma-70 family RNA polymerase sigma factor [Gemmataceae bacterium]|nr:sigma-70 family RNA polymerase sigma factor [Gemmataceae bacterium]